MPGNCADFVGTVDDDPFRRVRCRRYSRLSHAAMDRIWSVRALALLAYEMFFSPAEPWKNDQESAFTPHEVMLNLRIHSARTSRPGRFFYRPYLLPLRETGGARISERITARRRLPAFRPDSALFAFGAAGAAAGT